MRRIFVSAAILAAGFLAAGSPLSAHHGTGVAYQTDKWITLKGTVTEWIWSNPHCGILFDVTDDQGNVVHWGAELGNPHMLSGAGFSRDVLKPGDKVTVTGFPYKDGKKIMDILKVIGPNGLTLNYSKEEDKSK